MRKGPDLACSLNCPINPKVKEERNQDRPIKAAIDDFRRILDADGTLDGDEGRLRIGGVEHGILPDRDSGTVLKFTNVFYHLPWHCRSGGHHPGLPATGQACVFREVSM
jgi:hypothetical protein